MHIDHIYCSTYEQNVPITGKMAVKTDTSLTEFKFNEDECRRIQEICVEAYERSREQLIEEMRSNTPAVMQLADFSVVPEA